MKIIFTGGNGRFGKIFQTNTKLQNIINPFKKYIVTEINNQYYIDGIANKFIELTKDQTIMFDLSALTDRTKFEIVNNHFTSVAINTNDDTNFVFNYTGTENTLYYVKSNYKSKDTINFGNGSTPAISSTTYFHFAHNLHLYKRDLGKFLKPANLAQRKADYYG